ncbi:LysR family transcriptional regulator [Erythrobacter sp.]|uniref:LysR family transcriptional regulator n=1 Tax=Erythrobacter sp. TaxID=1042 RepID=UPI002EBDB4E7|nr:LysR family transcriptional regulator [Erythrobacter sp.]
MLEAGSLRAVAMEMGVDPSSISRKVSALEDRLQAKLLRRSTKRSEPTEAGQRYYEGVRRLLDECRALETDISGLVDELRGVLRIGAPVDFGARFVSPVVAQMLAEAPDLEVDLRLGSHFEDLTEAGLDAVVRIGRLTDSGLIARKVGAVPRIMVAAPDYIERAGIPETPYQLQTHDFIFYRYGQRRLPLTLSNGESSVTIDITSRVAANSVTAMRELVLAGAGLHQGPV